MKTLIVDDEQHNREILKIMLAGYGECDEVVNGQEAVDAFQMAYEMGTPYDLVCLDIMMPVMNGQDALKAIREMEREWGVDFVQAKTIIMITAMDTQESVLEAFYHGGCTAYINKPVMREKFLQKLKQFRLIH